MRKTFLVIFFSVIFSCDACERCIQEIRESQKEIQMNLDIVFASRKNITRDPLDIYVFGSKFTTRDDKDFLYNLDLSFLYYQGKQAENQNFFNILTRNHPDLFDH